MGVGELNIDRCITVMFFFLLNLDSKQWYWKWRRKFSKKTMDSMEKGIITKSVRTEVINSVAVQMLQHTTHPTSEEYTGVCCKLVDTFAVLKDTIGSGYVSELACNFVVLVYYIPRDE